MFLKFCFPPYLDEQKFWMTFYLNKLLEGYSESLDKKFKSTPYIIYPL
jgi:hypothetical protein